MRRLHIARAGWRAALSTLGFIVALIFVTSPVAAQDDRFIGATWGEPHGAVGSWGGPKDLVALARRYDGMRASQLGLPRALWCADFVNKVRIEAGFRPVPSRLARDQLHGGQRITEPVPGAVVILSRGRSGRAGHTGFVAKVLPGGDIVVVSGNHGGRVAESIYPRSRVVAFVEPTT